eukprot:CAMPEP_0198357072 /NCGR_PEP_ID=MMETSP1450-20131203/125354_1 /TAXON_ID=753684 ORGANISM="Madagascaria erythrocladiodes, Strain CCMP3234" /NCGR_SAMPLE_ID=MMETSP1450 /ASSEMBLY_ACC=CAM_ASM_001115 /LENGTH=45 /DNA_ID= /DNA_START= /DNA_END= /DNA_ORIENTATION=
MYFDSGLAGALGSSSSSSLSARSPKSTKDMLFDLEWSCSADEIDS